MTAFVVDNQEHVLGGLSASSELASKVHPEEHLLWRAECAEVGSGPCDRPFHGRYGSHPAGLHAPRQAAVVDPHQRHSGQVAVHTHQLGCCQVRLAGLLICHTL